MKVLSPCLIALLSLIVFLGGEGFGSKTTNEITFSRDVAPILFNNCAECHRPDDIAPFSVLSYREVRPWARSIREKVVTREMPPWHADPRYGKFANAARLSQKDIKTIVDWVDQGATEGDPAELPPQPDYVQGWRLGKPDLVFAMPEEYTIQPGAPDAYVYSVIRTRFKLDRWIQAAEIRPSNKKVVHHVIAHVMTPETVAKSRSNSDPVAPGPENDSTIFYRDAGLSRVRLDAPVLDDSANAPNGGAVFRRRIGEEGSDQFSMLLASYAPGKAPNIYPSGMAKRLPAGSTILLQVHYSSFRGALGKPQKDRTSVGLIFAREPPTRQVMTLTVQNHFFKIPPGADNHEVTAGYTLDGDVELIAYMPHMHLRGKDMRYELISTSGRRETLLYVPRFNFNWQTLYRLSSPVKVSRGTRIVVTAHFDNSPKNKYNPDPTRAVRWGDPTSDEMMIGWLEYVIPN